MEQDGLFDNPIQYARVVHKIKQWPPKSMT